MDDSPQACVSSSNSLDQTATHGDLVGVERDHDGTVGLCNEDQAGLSDWYRMGYDFVTDAVYQSTQRPNERALVCGQDSGNETPTEHAQHGIRPCVEPTEVSSGGLQCGR